MLIKNGDLHEEHKVLPQMRPAPLKRSPNSSVA